MIEKRKMPAGLVMAGGLLAIVCLVLFAFQDMSISNKLYNPESLFGLAFESFGFWPAVLAIPVGGAVWCAQRGMKEKKIMGFLILLLGYAGLWYKTLDELMENGAIKEISYIWLAILCIVFIAGTFFMVNQLGRTTLARLAFVCEVGAVYFIVYNLIGGSIKLLWGRWRYFEMLELGNFDKFSPWYIPQGINMHTSFPSGHVMSSCGIFLILLYICSKANTKRMQQIYTAIGCSVYVLCMAVSRIVMGRHFASDTIVGMLIAAFVYAIILYSKRYRKWFYYCRDNLDKVRMREAK